MTTECDDPTIPLIPAATLILMRDAPSGPPEILMVERAAHLSFAAGAWVFPGGRVDPDDDAIAKSRSLLMSGADLDSTEIAARVAAIRETVEEAGVAVALQPVPDAAVLSAIRARLVRGERFGALLAEHALRLDLASLTLFAWWRPRQRLTRNFDTRFYASRVPTDAPCDADGTESVRAGWHTARSVLEDHAAGRFSMILPTICNVQRLAQFDTSDAILADARSRVVRPLTAEFETRDGRLYQLLPDDQGYPVTVQPVDLHG